MRKPADLTFGNVAASACGGVATGAALSFAGATGTVVGAALGPVVFMVAKELVRSPAESAASATVRTVRGSRGATPAPDDLGEGDGAVRAGGTVPTRSRRRRRGGGLVLAATVAIAAVAALAALALPEVLADRPLVPGTQPVFVSTTAHADSAPADEEPQDGVLTDEGTEATPPSDATTAAPEQATVPAEVAPPDATPALEPETVTEPVPAPVEPDPAATDPAAVPTSP